MKVDVFPAAVGATQPQPGVEGLRRHRLTADRVQRLRGTDVGDVRRASFVVEDAHARINDVDAAVVLSRRLGLRRGVVEVKLLERIAFCALSQLHQHPSGRTVASPGCRGVYPFLPKAQLSHDHFGGSFLVNGQVTIIFVVSVGLFVCLCSFSPPSLIRF